MNYSIHRGAPRRSPAEEAEAIEGGGGVRVGFPLLMGGSGVFLEKIGVGVGSGGLWEAFRVKNNCMVHLMGHFTM